MLKIIVSSISLLFFVGCSMSHPAVTEYRVHSDVKNIEQTQSCSYTDKSIKISRAFSSNTLMSNEMKYVLGNTKEFSYTESQWAVSPSNAISSELLKLLRESKIFKNTQTSKSRSSSDIILETNIEEFVQHFNKDETKSYATVTISLTLINSKDNRVIGTNTFSSNVDTKTLDANGGVDALNKALSNVLLESSEWIKKVCR